MVVVLNGDVTSKGDKIMTGEEIREERQDLGLSQKRFAELVGLTQPILSEIETGARIATPAQLDAIIRFLSGLS